MLDYYIIRRTSYKSPSVPSWFNLMRIQKPNRIPTHGVSCYRFFKWRRGWASGCQHSSSGRFKTKGEQCLYIIPAVVQERENQWSGILHSQQVQQRLLFPTTVIIARTVASEVLYSTPIFLTFNILLDLSLDLTWHRACRQSRASEQATNTECHS